MDATEDDYIRAGGESWIKGRTLKPYRTGKGSGYLTVNLHGNCKDVNMKVHRLVATAFIPNPLNKPEVNHIDGNKKNNHVSNLEWATGAENVDHAYSNSLMKSGDESKSAKLTKEQVNYIRKVHVKGDSTFGAKPLAKRFGVSDVTIRNIVNGKKWTRVNDC
ncbi:MAG: HNH endonuclease [Oscillospiraceae bacterium]|nr:HNH endonuclease [Oscillospiraceae bacterium]